MLLLFGGRFLVGGRAAARIPVVDLDHVFARRLAEWQEKALREAKLHSDWSDPDAGYEDAARAFLMGLVDPDTLPVSPLSILDSNIEYLRGRTGSGSPAFAAPVGSLIPINGPINISFNQAVNSSSRL